MTWPPEPQPDMWCIREDWQLDCIYTSGGEPKVSMECRTMTLRANRNPPSISRIRRVTDVVGALRKIWGRKIRENIGWMIVSVSVVQVFLSMSPVFVNMNKKIDYMLGAPRNGRGSGAPRNGRGSGPLGNRHPAPRLLRPWVELSVTPPRHITIQSQSNTQCERAMGFQCTKNRGEPFLKLYSMVTCYSPWKQTSTLLKIICSADQKQEFSFDGVICVICV